MENQNPDRFTPPALFSFPPSPSEGDDRLYVGAVRKALSVFYAFQEKDDPLSLSEIAARTGIGRSAAQRFVHTLRILGYLQQDPGTRRYRLTARMLDFACAYLRNDPLVAAAFGYLREASRRTGETVNLTRRDDDQIIFVARFTSTTVISADLVIGSRLPVFCTSPGRAMLAHLPAAVADDILSSAPLHAHTPHTITDPKALTARLEDVRRNGFETAFQETFSGDLSIAAPIFRKDGRVCAAVNIAVATPRWSPERVIDELAPVVVETARAISANGW
jgi:PcaR/PcaU/PobR family beta-ketoadipate pathway transcriptional regulator